MYLYATYDYVLAHENDDFILLLSIVQWKIYFLRPFGEAVYGRQTTRNRALSATKAEV